MFRKNYFTFLFTIALFLACGTVAFAQVYPVNGRVMLKNTDNTTAPVAGALVEVFREDSKIKLPTAKTDKKGNFTFVNLLPGYKYIFSVSGTGISPMVYPGVSVGAEVVINVSPGDGKRFSEEEVKAAVKGQTSTTSTSTKSEPTEEEKKAEAERLKQIAEYNAKKTTIESKNASRQAALEEGNAAVDAKNYDLAIAKFEAGYQVDTVFLGSAPVFLTLKAKSLSSRTVDKFNKASKITDLAAKIEAMNEVIKDFGESIETFNTAWVMLKNAPATSIPDPKNYEINKMNILKEMQVTIGYMIQSEKVDINKFDLIKNFTQEYITVETDAAKKLKAQISLADLYRIAADSDNAIVEYRKTLEMSPDNPDALAGLGLSLFNSGEINNNLAQKQEGLGFMERFAEVAPDTHKLKASVAEAVTYLKSQKIVPQKVTTKKKQ